MSTALPGYLSDVILNLKPLGGLRRQLETAWWVWKQTLIQKRYLRAMTLTTPPMVSGVHLVSPLEE
ncbi:hypothetical protein ColTof4_11574 [Colletotrichum tofieldiae]|nr:hypothetical protein ColTof4_11574 [Colletotrichum tofieldiae]